MRKLTHTEQVAAIAKVNLSVEVLEEITGDKTKVLCRCKICLHEWKARPGKLKSGRGCPECKKIKIGDALRLTHDEQVAAINKVNPNVEILGEIINSRTKVLCRCLVCCYEWNVTPYHLKAGKGCPKCARQIKRTQEEYQADVYAANPNIKILGKVERVDKPVLCRCLVCGHEWDGRIAKIKKGGGCPKCAKIKIGNANRLPHTKHAADIAAKNPNVEIIGQITKVKDKVLTRCRTCGYEWLATPSSLKYGRGCPECGKIKQADKKRLTHDEQVLAINKVNPSVEVLGEIKGDVVKVLCRCKICHHEWKATPNNLKRGHGCPECKNKKIADAKRLTHAEQVAAVAKVNPNVEVLGEIKHVHKKVKCRCKICQHEWKTRPGSLKRGYGCPRCAKHGFLGHSTGKLYIMVDDLELPTMMKIGVSVREDRSKQVLRSAHKAGVTIPALHVAKTWEGPTDLMQRIESMMHDNYKEWNIKFPAKFDGYKEFFYYTPETAEAFDIIEETYHEIINANQAA